MFRVSGRVAINFWIKGLDAGREYSKTILNVALNVRFVNSWWEVDLN